MHVSREGRNNGDRPLSFGALILATSIEIKGSWYLHSVLRLCHSDLWSNSKLWEDIWSGLGRRYVGQGEYRNQVLILASGAEGPAKGRIDRSAGAQLNDTTSVVDRNPMRLSIVTIKEVGIRMCCGPERVRSQHQGGVKMNKER